MRKKKERKSMSTHIYGDYICLQICWENYYFVGDILAQ